MYTVTIATEITNGEVISRYFETKKAATKWFKWLCSQKMTLHSSFYRGNAGEELLERYEKQLDKICCSWSTNNSNKRLDTAKDND